MTTIDLSDHRHLHVRWRLWDTITLREGLLVCGILSSLLYTAMNVLIAAQWPSYRSMSQTVSELSAIGAPTRWVWNPLGVVYMVLVTAFGVGVVRSAEGNRSLRAAGVLITIYGALGLVWPFGPMHTRETLAAGGATFSDTLHLTLGGVTVLLYLVALGVASTALGRAFRAYSLITLAVVLVAGALTFQASPNVAKNLPTPFIGLWERVCIAAFLAWVVVLALALLRPSKGRVVHSAAAEPLDRFLKEPVVAGDEREQRH